MAHEDVMALDERVAKLEAVTALRAEMRRTTRAIRKEHEADRRTTKSVLLDHLTRIR